MINLIPIEEKQKMKIKFYRRLAVVSLFALSLAIFIAAISMLPAYFFATLKKKIVDTKLSNLESQVISENDQQVISMSNDVNNKISKIASLKKDNFVVSIRAINDVISEKMPDIKIGEITYDGTAASGKIIRVHGFASNRERLTMFRRSLEDNPSFKKVDLPISNFVKGSNIEFFLTIIPS